MSKLHLGCGDVILPGWINLDAASSPRVDVVDDAKTLASIPLQSVDVIYTSCMLEHFSHRDTLSILHEWRRRLIPGGVLRVSVPDFEAAVAEYSGGRPLQELLGLIIGGQKDVYDRHGSLFDFNHLKSLLEQAGFIGVYRYAWQTTDHAQHDDYSSAYLPHMNQAGRLMSLNVEATSPAIPEDIGTPEWYALGDSHVWTFTQARAHPGLFDAQRPVRSIDGKFLVNRLGPWTIEKATSDEGAATILRGVRQAPEVKKIILSFGEIDCRCRVMPKATSSGESPQRVCQDLAKRYARLVEDIVDLGRTVFVWNAPPPTGGPCFNTEFPFHGTHEECRAAVECLNEEMQRRVAQIDSAHFVDVYRDLVHGDRTQSSMYIDHIHLNPVKIWGNVQRVLDNLCQDVR